MCHNLKKWLFLPFDSTCPISLIPNHHKPVIRTTCKNILMELMPGNVLNWGIVIQDFSDW